MPTQLGTRYDPIPLLRPPGLSFFDTRIWNVALDRLRPGLLGVYYNVRVGHGRKPSPDMTDEQKKIWWQLTTKRIDALLEYRDAVWIAEIRRRAQSSAIGRLLTYKTLYDDDNPLNKRVNLMLITDDLDEDVQSLARQLHIGYINVGTYTDKTRGAITNG